MNDFLDFIKINDIRLSQSFIIDFLYVNETSILSYEIINKWLFTKIYKNISFLDFIKISENDLYGRTFLSRYKLLKYSYKLYIDVFTEKIKN